MTLIYDLIGLDILKVYMQCQNEVFSQCVQKLEHEQDRHTDRGDRVHYYNAVAAVIKQQILYSHKIPRADLRRGFFPENIIKF